MALIMWCLLADAGVYCLQKCQADGVL